MLAVGILYQMEAYTTCKHYLFGGVAHFGNFFRVSIGIHLWVWFLKFRLGYGHCSICQKRWPTLLDITQLLFEIPKLQMLIYISDLISNLMFFDYSVKM